jgi:cytochrome P450
MTIPQRARTETPLPRAGIRDTAAAVGGVLAPMLLQGVIARRRRAVALAGRLDLDGRAVRRMTRLRDRYGPGPLVLPLPLRTVALVLNPDDVARMLQESPEPFAAASLEKRGALGHFQPHGVLISRGEIREQRRRFVEEVLDTGRPLHRLAEPFALVAREEALALRRAVQQDGVLDWDRFMTAWWRVVRRVVLGDGAREDHVTTDLLTRLRRRANWSYLLPRRRDQQAELHERLRRYVTAAAPGSLAELVAGMPAAPGVDGTDQIPQWLFAFDPAGMAAYRALALVLGHPDQAVRVREEITGRDLDRPHDLPLLRASVLESVRLWPTTAVVLRDTTAPTVWPGGTLAAGAAVGVVSAFFHRDPATVADADRFDPDAWCDGSADDAPALVPFSAGPVACPGRELVLLTTSLFLASLLEDGVLAPGPGFPVDPDRPLPAALDAFALRFAAATPT